MTRAKSRRARREPQNSPAPFAHTAPTHDVGISTAAHLAAIVESSTDAIYSYDFTGTLLSWNDAAEALYGYTSHDILGRSVELLIPEDRRTEAVDRLVAGIRRGEVFRNFETIRKRRNGELFDAAICASPVRNAAGLPVAVSVLVRDISERRRVEEERRAHRDALQRSEGRLRAATEAARLGVFECDLDTGQLTRTPRAAEMCGQPGVLETTVDAALATVHAEDAARARELFAARLDSGESAHREAEVRFHMPNGELRVIAFQTEMRSRTTADGQPRSTHLVGACADVTERRALESRLQLHARITHQISDAIVATDSAMRVVMWNPAAERLYGIPASEAIGAPLTSLYTFQWDEPGDDVEAWQSLESSGTWRGENTHVTRTGRVLQVESLVSQITQEGGTPVGLIASIRDITERKRAEAALRESEERFRAMADGLPLMVWVHDAEGRQTFVNKTFREFFGVPLEATIGSRWQALLHPDDARAYTEAFLHATTHHLPFHAEARVRNASGEWRHVESWGRPRLGASGEFIGVVGTSADVTERREAESRLRLALDAAYLISFDWDIRKNEVRRMHSSSRTLPATTEDALGTFETVRQAVHPDDRERFTQNVFRALAWPTQPYTSEHRLMHADGSITWVAERGRVECDDTGQPVRLLGLSQDITVRKLAETELQQSELRLRLAHTAGQIGSWAFDPATRETEWGEESYSLFGVDRSTPNLYEAWYYRVHPDDREQVNASLRECLASGDTHVEYRYQHPQLGERWLMGRAKLLTQPDGSRRIFGVNLDITDRKRHEESLLEADRQKDAFLAMLAHELRNPLAPIRTAVAVLRTRGIPEAALGRCRDVIERQVGQMANLLDDLLDVSRLSQGKLTLHSAPVLLQDALETALETSRPMIDARRHHLRVHRTGDPLVVEGDLARLTQILANLLNNAAKFTPAGGTIDVSVGVEDAQAVLRVKDSGIGIAHEHLDRIFDLFTQIEERQDGARAGLGIGLSLVRQLVQMHGGTIGVTSAGPGRGSEFTVRLPLVGHPESTLPAPIPEYERTKSLNLRVVVADDNVDAAETLTMLLESLGCAVRTAHGGAAAVREVLACQPHVVLMDLGMPDVDGYEACRSIRGAGIRTSIVALTGWGQDEDRRRTALAGFNAHLVKPVAPQALIDLLKTYASAAGLSI